MLSRIGKISIAIVMAGGMVLLGGDVARAAESSCGSVPDYPIPCDSQYVDEACNNTAGHWFIGDGGYYCPSYNGQCTMWCEGNVIEFEWSISYEWSASPCPTTLPC